MILHLECIRCGNPDDMDPFGAPIGTGVTCVGWCYGCRFKFEVLRRSGVSWHRRYAMMRRAQREQDRHPTYKALSAALDALELTPHGTLTASEVL